MKNFVRCVKKGGIREKIRVFCCRSLRGSVDWNLWRVLTDLLSYVAPYAGAWIEIVSDNSVDYNIDCRSLRGSVDWNYDTSQIVRRVNQSLPTRERGLKFVDGRLYHHLMVSLPTRERGLKYDNGTLAFPCRMSLPTRERGLKSSWGGYWYWDEGRSLRGSVDWNYRGHLGWRNAG